MKRFLELAMFLVLALVIHLALSWMLETDAPLAAGGDATQGSVIAAAGDLSELIDSWEEAPDTAEALEIAPRDVVDDIPKQPDGMTEAKTFDVSELMSPDQPIARPVPPQQAWTAVVSREVLQTLAVQQPTETLPVRTDTGPDLPMLAKPQTTANASLPLPQQTAALIPEPEPEPVAAEAEAPLIASLPRKKPAPPKAVKPKAQKKATAKKKAENKTQKKKSAEKPTVKAFTAQAPAKPKKSGGDGTSVTSQASAGAEGGQGRTAALQQGADVSAVSGGYSRAAINLARKSYAAAVNRAIARKKKYPRKAERRGITGRPTLRVTLDASGRLIAATILKSSGSDLLDNAAIAAAKRVQDYPKIPKEIGKPRISVTLGMRFKKR